MRVLDDIDPMPFGAHKGKRMERVPASYLHYLHANGIHESTGEDRKQVSDYIKRNLSALKQEHKDGIW